MNDRYEKKKKKRKLSSHYKKNTFILRYMHLDNRMERKNEIKSFTRYHEQQKIMI
jgi:hypothetical protein